MYEISKTRTSFFVFQILETKTSEGFVLKKLEGGEGGEGTQSSPSEPVSISFLLVACGLELLKVMDIESYGFFIDQTNVIQTM